MTQNIKPFILVSFDKPSNIIKNNIKSGYIAEAVAKLVNFTSVNYICKLLTKINHSTNIKAVTQNNNIGVQCS